MPDNTPGIAIELSLHGRTRAGAAQGQRQRPSERQRTVVAQATIDPNQPEALAGTLAELSARHPEAEPVIRITAHATSSNGDERRMTLSLTRHGLVASVRGPGWAAASDPPLADALAKTRPGRALRDCLQLCRSAEPDQLGPHADAARPPGYRTRGQGQGAERSAQFTPGEASEPRFTADELAHTATVAARIARQWQQRQEHREAKRDHAIQRIQR